MAIDGCLEQRGVAVVVGQVDLGAVAQQQLDHLERADADGVKQRGIAVDVADIGTGAPQQGQLGVFVVALHRGVEQIVLAEQALRRSRRREAERQREAQCAPDCSHGSFAPPSH